MRYCNRCVMPDTKPGIIFDEKGICSACRSAELKYQINWELRQKSLSELCQNIKKKNSGTYDCLVPVSGGKDSMYQAYLMSKVYGLKVLVVCVTAHLQTKEGIENLNSLVDTLGVDCIKINVKPSALRKLRRYALINFGNPNFAEHRVVFSAVTRTAEFHKIPLVAWGEDIAVEFGGNIDKASMNEGLADELINNDLFREGDWDAFAPKIAKKEDLFFYSFPKIEQLRNLDIRTIYLGYYHWWDSVKHVEIAKKLGFRGRENGPLSGNLVAWNNMDEKLCEVHLYLKFLKHGFWRPTDQVCYHIWNGYMSRNEAVDIVNEIQYQFPQEYLQDFLDYHSITEGELFDLFEKFRNKNIWKQVNGQWRLKTELKKIKHGEPQYSF